MSANVVQFGPALRPRTTVGLAVLSGRTGPSPFVAPSARTGHSGGRLRPFIGKSPHKTCEASNAAQPLRMQSTRRLEQTLVQADDPIHPAREALVVRRHERGTALASHEGEELGEHRVGGMLVEIAGRFVG